MIIELKGHQICNLFTGGDRRDKSLQKVIEGTSHELFLVKKFGGNLEVWQVDQVPVLEFMTSEEEKQKIRGKKEPLIKRKIGKQKKGK